MHTTLRHASKGDIDEVHDLVEEVFDMDISHHYTEEGIRTFKGYIDPEMISRRMDEGSILLVARDLEDGSLAGMIMTKGYDHISLFFVRKDLQGRGIGRSLLDRLLDDLLKEEPHPGEITVNSSPNSVEIYGKMGFKTTDAESTLHGIRFQSMKRIIR